MFGSVVQQYWIAMRLGKGVELDDSVIGQEIKFTSTDFSTPGFVSGYRKNTNRALVTLYHPMMPGIDMPKVPLKDIVRTELTVEELSMAMERAEMIHPGLWDRRQAARKEEYAEVVFDDLLKDLKELDDGMTRSDDG